MFYDKFLVLRKTLMEFLDKNFIYISNFLITVFILFAKKLNEGLRFYINYYILNALI